MAITLETTCQNEVWPGSSKTSLTGSEPGYAEEYLRHRCLVLAVLVVPIGFACWAYLDPGSVSLVIIIMGQARVRKTYRLSVKVDPKINAFLTLEKARTGITISEVVETVFKEYQAQRDDKKASYNGFEFSDKLENSHECETSRRSQREDRGGIEASDLAADGGIDIKKTQRPRPAR